MLKMLVLHCHTSFGVTIHGLMDALKNAKCVVNQGTTTLNLLQQFLCIIHCWSVCQFFFMSPKEEIKRFTIGKWLGQDSGPYYSISTAPCRQFQGNLWQSNWYWLGHHLAWTTSFIKYLLVQYPITLAKWAPRNVHCILSVWGKIYWPTKQSPTVSAQTLIENCCSCPEWIVLCVFVSFQMYQLRKFIMLLFVKPAPSLKSTLLLKNRTSSHCQRNNRQNSVHRELATAMHATSLAACIQPMLVHRFSSKQLSIPYSTPPVCAPLCLKWGLCLCTSLS